MKRFISIVIIISSQAVWAVERVIQSDEKTFSTEISAATVRCSELGYGLKELKINLAALDGWTLFDHSNSAFGEFGEPCMTAGMCRRTPTGPGFSVSDLVGNNPGHEVITVRRRVSEIRTEAKDEQGQGICIRSLREDLSTQIRGIEFHHSRSGAEQNFAVEYCRK